MAGLAPLAVVVSNFATRAQASKVAERLLDERLVACANMFPVRSTYAWKGKRERAEEVAVLFKTTRRLARRAARRLAELHPYEVPCIEVWPVTAAGSYAAWVRGEVRGR